MKTRTVLSLAIALAFFAACEPYEVEQSYENSFDIVGWHPDHIDTNSPFITPKPIYEWRKNLDTYVWVDGEIIASWHDPCSPSEIPDLAKKRREDAALAFEQYLVNHRKKVDRSKYIDSLIHAK